jgi:hypothetical protein
MGSAQRAQGLGAPGKPLSTGQKPCLANAAAAGPKICSMPLLVAKVVRLAGPLVLSAAFCLPSGPIPLSTSLPCLCSPWAPLPKSC